MKNKIKFLIIGIIIGVFCVIAFIKVQNNAIGSSERKKEAIIFAQKLIKEKFNKEEKFISIEGENPYYEGIEFPPISKTEVEITELKTYVIEFYAKYHENRQIKYYPEQDYYISSKGDLFYVELEYKNGNWTEIESRRVSR